MLNLYGCFVRTCDNSLPQEMIDFCYAEDLASAISVFVTRYEKKGGKVSFVYGNYFELSDTPWLYHFVSALECVC